MPDVFERHGGPTMADTEVCAARFCTKTLFMVECKVLDCMVLRLEAERIGGQCKDVSFAEPLCWAGKGGLPRLFRGS